MEEDNQLKKIIFVLILIVAVLSTILFYLVVLNAPYIWSEYSLARYRRYQEVYNSVDKDEYTVYTAIYSGSFASEVYSLEELGIVRIEDYGKGSAADELYVVIPKDVENLWNKVFRWKQNGGLYRIVEEGPIVD